jgi:hypothetical protein
MKIDVFSSILFVMSELFDSIKTFESGSIIFFLWTWVTFRKKVVCHLSIRHRYNDEGVVFWVHRWQFPIYSIAFCHAPHQNVSFLQIFPGIGIEKNVLVINRCGKHFQSSILMDFVVFLSITASSQSKFFWTTTSCSIPPCPKWRYQKWKRMKKVDD